jgi:hypothetical protein
MIVAGHENRNVKKIVVHCPRSANACAARPIATEAT